MKKMLATLWAMLFIFGVSGTAAAVSFSGTAVGSWQNVVSSDPGDLFWVNNNDSGSMAYFNWGTPATTEFNNQFTFDGVGSDGLPGWSANSEDAFLIGDFTYRNGSTYNSTGINGVDLNILLQITNPLGISDNYIFDFSITNTPNNTGNSVQDGDIVTVESSFSPTTFFYDGTEYTLALIGFSSDGGTTIRTDFSSPEGENAYAGLYAKITSEIPNPVPEPATMLLLASGLVGLAGLRRKFRR